MCYRGLVAFLVLLLLRLRGNFVSQSAAGVTDDWKERKIRLRCGQLLSDRPVWACGALVPILFALVRLDRDAFNFIILSSQAWCLSRVGS